MLERSSADSPLDLQEAFVPGTLALQECVFSQDLEGGCSQLALPWQLC